MLEISGLSSNVDTESPRFTGAPNAVRVLDVVCKRKSGRAPDADEDERVAAIKSLQAQRNVLKAEQEIRFEEIDLLNDSGRLLTNDTHHNPDHEKLLAFMDKYVQRKRCIKKAIQDLDQQMEDIDKKMSVLHNARKGQTTTTVIATIIATNDCKVELNLTYCKHPLLWVYLCLQFTGLMQWSLA